MAIEFKSGLVHLVEGVRTYFELQSVTAKVSLGSKERTKQINQGPGGANRIVFQPWNASGGAGKLIQPRSPGPRDIKDENGVRVATVRSLKSWERLVTVSVWATGKDEEEILEETEKLFEWVVRAVNYASQASVVWGEVAYTVDPKELTYGRELLATFTLNQPIFDLPNEVAYPGVGTIAKELNQNEPEDA